VVEGGFIFKFIAIKPVKEYLFFIVVIYLVNEFNNF